MNDMSLTADRLRHLLDYDQITGEFTRRVRVNSRAPVGQVVGYDDGHGYLQVTIDGKGYQLNRLAWLHVTGEWPAGEVDHRDGVKRNNRWVNLRDVTHQVNTQNIRRATKANKLGVLGVVQRAAGFEANIKSDGRVTYLGAYRDPSDAHAAYVAAKRRIHEGCTL